MAGPFGATSTTDEVLEGVDLSGKRILVTGVSAGLGVETARALAAHGATGGRRRARPGQGQAARPSRCAPGATNGGGLELVELDLASLASVRACADAPGRRGQALRPGDRQRRRHGHAQGQDRRRLRDPVRHQPPGPLRAGQPDRLAAEARLAAGEPVLGRPPLLRRRPRRSELRAHALRRVRRLWPLEDRQHPVRRRVRPPAQGATACAPPPCIPAASRPSSAAT